MKIYHNPRCTKSRQTLQLIKDNGTDVEVVEYLKNIPTKEELERLLTLLNMEPEALVRKGEAVYKEQLKGRTFSKEEWIQILIENPKLIERPIVVKGNKAIIGRPPENVLALL